VVYTTKVKKTINDCKQILHSSEMDYRRGTMDLINSEGSHGKKYEYKFTPFTGDLFV
jgi:hypothetical protein